MKFLISILQPSSICILPDSSITSCVTLVCWSTGSHSSTSWPRAWSWVNHTVLSQVENTLGKIKWTFQVTVYICMYMYKFFLWVWQTSSFKIMKNIGYSSKQHSRNFVRKIKDMQFVTKFSLTIIILTGEKPVEKGTGEEVLVQWEKMSKSKYNGVDPQV